MAKKKLTRPPISQQDNTQAQPILEQYHQIANNLHTSADRKQAEAALTDINTISETAQIALLKALSREQHTDAADVLLAINTLSPSKNIRKEARRSLIQLESTRIYPQWSPPAEPIIQVLDTANPPRFFKGLVSDSRAVDEVQLTLCWEQGDNYREVRVLSFLLDFLHDGVKDFFTRVESKRSLDNLIARMSDLYDVTLKPCSLAKGQRLLLEALAINKKHGTTPYSDYRLNLSLVKQLILEAPDLGEADDLYDDEDLDLDDDEDLDEDIDLNEDEDLDEVLDLHDLDPLNVVTNFVESWVDGDYELSYKLLSTDSPIREGLSEEDWTDRRAVWSDHMDAFDLEPNFFYEREPQKSGLWLPNLLAAQRTATHKEIEVGWSIELKAVELEDEDIEIEAIEAEVVPSLNDPLPELPQATQSEDEQPEVISSLNDPLPELPQATVFYKETDRHWFWTTYTLVQDQGEWRIQSITDEGKNAQTLSTAELQKRIQECNDHVDKLIKKHKPTDADVQQYVQEVLRYLMQSVYYTDALILQMPLERVLYENAVSRLILTGQLERGLVYLEPMIQLFPQERPDNLRGLATVYAQLSKKYADIGDDERAERFQELGEEAVRESLTLEDNLNAHISLAEILIDKNELDAAEEHLLQAKAAVTDPHDDAHIELHLGEIAMERDQYQQALTHYQRVAEVESDAAESWSDLARVYEKLEQFTEAEANYKHAIELEPDNDDLYYALGKLYIENDQPEKAIETMEEGVGAKPEAAIMYVYLASTYIERDDYDQAEVFLDKAEELDPNLKMIDMFRQMISFSKSKPVPTKPAAIKSPSNISKLGRHKKKKKR